MKVQSELRFQDLRPIVMAFQSVGRNGILEPSFLAVECVDAPNLKDFARGEPCILGIDEAGRGPVLGPMVYGCAIVKADKLEELKSLGVDDSKALSAKRRSEIFENVRYGQNNFFSYSLQVVHPRLIAVQMKRRLRKSLNEISHNCAIELIRRVLQNGICVQEIFVDLVGQKAEIYQELLLSHFPSLRITVSKKADSIYPVVGAASIVAKVTRDARIDEWTFEEKDFDVPTDGIGSGYPSDPLSKRFIASRIDPIFGYPSLVRFSWKTVERVLERRAVKCEWNALVSDAPKQRTLEEFWASKQGEKTPKKFKRHAFFADRGISNIAQMD